MFVLRFPPWFFPEKLVPSYRLALMKKFLGHLSSIKKNLWCWTIWFQRLSKKNCYTLFCTWITSFALKILKKTCFFLISWFPAKEPKASWFPTFFRVQSTEVVTPSVMDVIQGGNLFWRSQSIPASHISRLSIWKKCHILLAGSYFIFSHSKLFSWTCIDIKTKKDNSILNSVSSKSQLSYDVSFL